MGGKYTPAQKAATDEYMKDKKTLRVIVPKSKAEIIKNYAKSKGESVSAYVNRLIDEDMEKGL